MTAPPPQFDPDTPSQPWLADVRAAVAVTMISVPQGVAYAPIAGLPPAMGLYAGALPAIVGSLFRSSRHVVTGPTNAISLLVGTSVAAQAPDPVSAAATLALLVGLFQVGAGVLRLGAVADYISSSVVLGYITGAGVLIGVGQLANVTRTSGGAGDIATKLMAWASTVPSAHPISVGIALGSAALILALRWFGAPRGSGAIATIGLGMAAARLFSLDEHGVVLVRDLAAIPRGLPPLVIPDLSGAGGLIPVAVAATVLSLVESSSVARSISARTGQRLDIGREFIGQGLANVAAAFSGGYPVSGSLSRSALNERVGAQSRAAGMLTGVFMLVVLVALGPLVNWTPIPSLAGLLLVVAVDLVDVAKIRTVLRSGMGDVAAFAGTVIGTWTLPLDQAIYVGVGISIVLFLQRARLLVGRELMIDTDLHLREAELDVPADPLRRCDKIRILHIEGPLFFGAAAELDDLLRRALADPKIEVLIVRLKRAQGLDLTTAAVLAETHERMREAGRTLLLVGLRPPMVERLAQMGLAETFGADLFPTEPGWFVAMNCAIERALELIGDGHGDRCPLVEYRDHRRERGRVDFGNPLP